MISGLIGLVSWTAGIYAQDAHSNSTTSSPSSTSSTADAAKVQPFYPTKDFSHLIGTPGFSDYELNTHFTLYQGYVTNTNLLLHFLQKLANEGKNRSPEYAELKRRFGWEFDGMRLHELYFENLGGKGGALNAKTDLYRQIEDDFGSFEAWKNDFIATGAMRGIGWAILYQDAQNGKLMNVWINEHDLGHLATGRPLLIMDVWEHAYLLDYGLDRAKYIHAFFNVVHWDAVVARFIPVERNGTNVQNSPPTSSKSKG